MIFGRINMNPAANPAVLDTATWDAEAAARLARAVDATYWQAVREGIARGFPLSRTNELIPFAGSAAMQGGQACFLAQLADGQQVFVSIGPEGGEALLGAPFLADALGDARLAFYRTDAPVIDRYTRLVRPDKGPRAMGPIPRLGIGTRMSAAMWPGIYEALDRGGFAANTIQDSVLRELELLENILAARPPEAIHLPGFGVVESGHTGSTCEGLWTYGVLEALKSEGYFRYGADADHLKMAHGAEGRSHAKHVLEIARFYTFFTLDVSEVLGYEALMAKSGVAAAMFESAVPSPSERADVLSYHSQKRSIGDVVYAPDEERIGRLAGKYWEALAAAADLGNHIARFKEGRPFDLEFAVDERTPDVGTCDCITSDDEVFFALLELQRRGVPVTHLAPNFGVEKSVDYRCPGGLADLEERVGRQYRIAEEFGVLLDFHSGDDLSSATRRAIARATQGRNHFKIAPMPQEMFAQTVEELLPDLFARWWADSLAYARHEAERGSQFAARCLAEQRASGASPSAHDIIFHNFGFAFVGKRDAAGNYLNRETLYSLPVAFYDEYRKRLVAYLCMLAEELLRP